MARGWADLPSELLGSIVSRVPCAADRLRVAVVCHSWRDALAGLEADNAGPAPAPQLPWLLYPRAGDHGPSFFRILTSGSTHRARLPDDGGHARYFGSYEGGWLFVAIGQVSGHTLLNFRSGDRVRIPDVIVGKNGEQSNVLIRAAALSSPPGSPRILVAGINHSPFVMFWPLRDPQAWTPVASSCLAPAEDVIYYRGGFHVLTRDENIMAYFSSDRDPAGPTLDPVRMIFARTNTNDDRVVARYLVESSGNLIMVVRIAPVRGSTSRFRLFHMLQIGGSSNAWVELYNLRGRMLFVGRGCSRSFQASAASYKGMGFQGGVYFLDDRGFHHHHLAAMDQPWLHPCSDMGRWLRSPSRIDSHGHGKPPTARLRSGLTCKSHLLMSTEVFDV